MAGFDELRDEIERYLLWSEGRWLIRYQGMIIESAFQPIFDISGKLIGYEALMRPTVTGKPVAPDRVLSLLRRRDDVVFFDRLMRAAHLRNYALLPVRSRYLFMNYELDSILTVSDVGAYISLQNTRLKELGIANTNIVMEILEHEASSETRLALMSQWRRAVEGVHLALDDVRDTPLARQRIQAIGPDIIKLDRSELFNPGYEEFVQTLKEGRWRLLQEGIETEEQYRRVCAVGIDWYQGRYLGCPQPTGELVMDSSKVC